MRTLVTISVMALAIPLLLTGCKGDEQTKTVEAKQYAIKGKVLAIDANKPSVKLDHEDIPGLMKAMKMKFTLEGPKVAEGLQPGDRVEGHLQVKSGEYVITHLEKR